MNKDNVFMNPDVIEDCLSECFDVYEKHSHEHAPDKTSEVNELA
jgi:hypothetical protein